VSKRKMRQSGRNSQRCHRALATPHAEGFVSEVRNRGKKFVTKDGKSLSSIISRGWWFETEEAALEVAESYVRDHFTN